MQELNSLRFTARRRVGQRAVEVGLRLHAPREAEQRRGRWFNAAWLSAGFTITTPSCRPLTTAQTFDVAFGEVEIPAKLRDRAHLVERTALPFPAGPRGCSVAPDHGHVEVLPDREGPGGNRRGGQFRSRAPGSASVIWRSPVVAADPPIGNQARHRAGRDGRRVGAEHQCAAGTADAAQTRAASACDS